MRGNPSDPVFIYALIDPRQPEVFRYVGWSLRPERRLRSHKKEALRNVPSYKARWLCGLLQAGLEPLLQILEQCLRENWQERETFWIAKAKAEGCPLTNMTAGGDGVLDPPAEVLERMRLGPLNPSEERRAEMRTRMLGNKHALGSPGHTPSLEERENLRIRNAGNTYARGRRGMKNTPEARERMHQAAVQRWEDEQQHEAARLAAQLRFADPAERERVRLSRLGAKASPEARANMSRSHLGNKSRTGQKRSPEEIAKGLVTSAATRARRKLAKLENQQVMQSEQQHMEGD